MSADPTFSDLGLSPVILKTLEGMGFEKPSPVQALTIPTAMRGKDIIGIAQTGSGKTAAFGIPILERIIEIDDPRSGPLALVVCPTRELAVQVGKAILEFGKGIDRLSVATLYGGASYDQQRRELRNGAQIVVGTPGRILDHLKRGYLNVGNVKIAVLDEADRMLDMGFMEEMEGLLEQLPDERQALFFSATMEAKVKRLIGRFSKDAEYLEVKQTSRAADTVTQVYYDARWQSKPEILFRLLEMEPPQAAIVFCNTKKVVDECVESLLSNGFPADRLHGDMTQPMRDRVLKRFRDGQVSLLVATDVAGRGIDVSDVDLVFNYDLPRDVDDYVHRIGRTGRAGREGRAITLISRREQGLLSATERHAGGKITRKAIPTPEQLKARRAELLLVHLRAQLGLEDPAAASAVKAGVAEEAEVVEDVVVSDAPLVEPDVVAAPAVEGDPVTVDGEETPKPKKAKKEKLPTGLAGLVAQGVTWEAISAALLDLWSGATTRELEFIPEDKGQGRKAGKNDRQDREPGAAPWKKKNQERSNDRWEQGTGDRGGKRDRERRDRDGGDRDSRGSSYGRDRDDKGGKGGYAGDRDSGHPAAGRGVPAGKRRVFVGLGKIDSVSPGELAGMLYNESQVPDGSIGKISLFGRHTLVDVDESVADKLVQSARGARYRGRSFPVRFDNFVE